MLVDVVLLRQRGRKLDRDQLRAPVRGMLQVDTCNSIRTPEHRETPRLAVLIGPGVAESLLPPLLFARLGKMRGWQFVIVGMEEESTWRKYPPRHRQAWWCRVVRDPRSGGLVQASTTVDAPAPRPRVGQVEPA